MISIDARTNTRLAARNIALHATTEINARRHRGRLFDLEQIRFDLEQ